MNGQPVSALKERLVLECRTELRCRAEHPDARRIQRFRGRMHGALLFPIPFLAEATGRVLTREEDAEVGHIPAYCSKCRLYTEYEVVAPEAADRAQDPKVVPFPTRRAVLPKSA